VLVFLWEYRGLGLDRHVLQYGYYPCSVEGPCTQPYTLIVSHPSWPETVLTSMFMHGSVIHLAGNMLFLWIFGNNVEDVMGRARFLVWYLACGVAATTLQTYVTLHFAGAQDASIPNVGASGAIAGVLGAYFLILPRANVLSAILLGFFFIFREIPAIVFLGIWFLFQAVEGGFAVTHPRADGGVAFFAHIGGFLFGVATVHLVARERPLAPNVRFRW
jgi:membrane associated rhomboid family serine protease